MEIGDLIRDVQTQRIGLVVDIYESIAQTHYKVLNLKGGTEWFPKDFAHGKCEVVNEDR